MPVAKTNPLRYRPEELDALRRLWDGTPAGVAAISRQTGRSAIALRSKALKLGLKWHGTAGARVQWTAERIDLLRKVYPSGGRHAAAQALGVTPDAAVKQAFRLGLTSCNARRTSSRLASRILELYHEGFEPDDIYSELRCCPTTVLSVLDANGCFARVVPTTPRPHRPTQEDLQLAARLTSLQIVCSVCGDPLDAPGVCAGCRRLGRY